MENINIKNGLVGLFDILGYQSFLENNDAETATLEVVSTISSISDNVTSYILSLEDVMSAEQMQLSIKNIQWLVFSDTILMVLECDPSDIIAGLTFLGTAGSLFHHMFDFGLPLRGAITRGKYLLSKSCFAGRAIIEAYKMGTNLELAACTINETSIKNWYEILTEYPDVNDLFEDLVVTYMTPLKDDTYKKIVLLNYLACESPNAKPITSDVEQMVLDSFWSHNKDMTLSAEIKAKNTMNFFRYLKHKKLSLFNPPTT